MEIINKICFKNFKKYVCFFIIILFFGVITFFLVNQNIFLPKIEKINQNSIKFVKIAGQIIKVELALTKKEQKRGLSERENLKKDEGMLFIFKKPAKNYFWMKDMNFPIDMIWINDDLKVIYIEKNIEPSSYPKTFGPGVDNRYVLEVNALFSGKNNLRLGDTIEFLY